MPFSPYIAIAAFLAVIGASLGGYSYGVRHQSALDQVAIEHQKAEAARVRADETAKVLERERINSELNATLEKERHDAQAQHVADNVNLRDAMGVWKRAHPGCRAGGDSAPGQNTGSGGAADAAGGGIEQLPAGSGAFIQRIAAAADTLKDYARECHAFVTTLEK